MKKYLGSVLILSFLMLSSCLEAEFSIDIKKDESGTASILYRYNKEFLADLHQNLADDLNRTYRKEAIESNLLLFGGNLSLTNHTINETDEFLEIQIDLEFSHVNYFMDYINPVTVSDELFALQENSSVNNEKLLVLPLMPELYSSIFYEQNSGIYGDSTISNEQEQFLEEIFKTINVKFLIHLEGEITAHSDGVLIDSNSIEVVYGYDDFMDPSSVEDLEISWN